MGARLLRTFIEQPLIHKKESDQRLDAVDALYQNEIGCEELREYLNPVYDLERLAGRISYRSANPRDLVALKTSLSMLPAIKTAIRSFPCGLFQEYEKDFDTLADLFQLIDRAALLRMATMQTSMNTGGPALRGSSGLPSSRPGSGRRPAFTH